MDKRIRSWTQRAGVIMAAGLTACMAPRAEAPAGPDPVGLPAPSVSPVSDLPQARRLLIEEELHGQSVSDPYRWLENADSEETQAFMRAHDARARAVLARTSRRDDFASRLSALSYVGVRSAPVLRGSRRFWSEKAAGREKAIYYWQEGEGEKKVLLDPLVLAPDGTLAIGGVFPSPDGRLVAVLENPDNADESTLKVLRVATASVLEKDTIHGLRYTRPSWSAEGDAFVYTGLPPEKAYPDTNARIARASVKLHRIGTSVSEDEVLRRPTGDPSKFQGASFSDDGRWMIATVARGWSENQVSVSDARVSPDDREWTLITPPDGQAIYDVKGLGEQLFIRTNEGASRYRIFSARAPRLGREDWKEIVGEDEDTVLRAMVVAGGHLVLHAMRNASSALVIYTLQGKKLREVELPGLGTVGALVGRAEDDLLYFGFEGFDRPDEIWSTNVRSGQTELFHRPEVPLVPGAFEVRQVRYPSKDGTSVTMFVVHNPSTEKRGDVPTLLYGYGGFNISRTPTYDPLIVTWVEAGGVYAVPNLRGGGEYGEDWHRAGMLEHKQNVFDDFVAAAESLSAEGGWTSARRLGIYGRSNGGLLVGAAMTQRPDLYRAVVCGVPLLDMVRYHRFGIGRAWIPEYGSAEDATQFGFLHAYSPYHRVEEGTPYPALLMLSADHDDRVDPLHARKFVAAYRHANAGPHEALLRIEAHSGHGGGDKRSKRVARQADVLAFLARELSL